jgi:hypothetical protein
MAMKEMGRVIRQAKHDWAHTQLHKAANTWNIWEMVAHRKGQCSNFFLALCKKDGTLTNDPTEKANIFQQKFFPDNRITIKPSQQDNLDPLPTRKWDQITKEEVAEALVDTSNKSAPGPSGTGYSLIKWVNKECPDLLTCIYNLALGLGVHPWKLTTVVIINKPNKPNYNAPKAYQPISLLECATKLLEKIMAN